VIAADYLARAAGTRFRWGAHDCCLWIADWLVLRGHADPAADLRGRYRTARGAARVLSRHGGVPGLFASRAALAGLPRTEAPVAGDIGVVQVTDLAGDAKPAGAICTGARWACLAPTGLLVFPATPLSAWSV
jgi:hypothetical protein